MRLGCSAICRTSEQSWKIEENSWHIVVFRFLVLDCVICSAEKSNTSSESNRRMAMLFSQMERLLRHELMISLIKSGQSWGQSCFRIDTRTRFSLLMRILCCCKLSGEEEAWMINPTTKFRIPKIVRLSFQIQYRRYPGVNICSPCLCSLGNIFHRVWITLSRTCSPRTS